MSLTTSSRRVLAGWTPPDRAQAALRDLYLDHLDRHPQGWSRDCPGQHLTASTLIISPARDRVLLTLHRRMGRWLQTGGHIEPDDHDLRSAALREATEESGLPAIDLGEPLLLSRHEVPCGPVRPSYHLDVQFLAVAHPDQPVVVSDESDDVRWFGVGELPEVDDTVLALVAAARAAGPVTPRC